jgi:hypothetical protein
VNVNVSLSNTYTSTVTVDYAVAGGTATLDADYALPAAGSFVQALKRDAGLTTGGSLSSQFTSLGSGDVLLTSVRDALLYQTLNGRYMNYGVTTLIPGATGSVYVIIGFDVSGLAGATINKAELRFRCTQGNSAMSWAAVKSHDWVEGTKSADYPGASPASPGVCFSHPAGLYTGPSGASGWGANADAMFDAAGEGADLYAWTNFTSTPVGAAWTVANVTAAVQDWISGIRPNYGLVVNIGNHSSYMSEQGSVDQPVLFVDYTLTNRLSFAPGQTTRAIAVTVIDDANSEPTETFTLALSNSVNATLGTRTSYTYTILDNDNQAPAVDAGADQAVTLPGGATLDATVTDDGLPNPPATVTVTWSKVSGPGTVTFEDSAVVDTAATFSAAGTYVLQISADDSLVQVSDTVTVTVRPMPTLQFSSTTASGDEATSPANLNITLSSTTPHVITVNYDATGGSATEGIDYALPPPVNKVFAVKRSAGLVSGGVLDSQFTTLGAGDVVPVTVKDARIGNAGNGRYTNYGASTTAPGSSSPCYFALGFDLSAYAGSAVNRAQLRLRTSQGNTTMQLAGIKSHNWVEGTKNGAYPGADPAAEGVCYAHPAGLYTAPSGAAGWGPNSDTMLDLTGNGMDLYAWQNFQSVPGGAAYVVADITDLVADWLSGVKPNYGMIVSYGNHSTYLSEYGSDYEPVLFLDVDLPYHQLTIEPNLAGKSIPVTVVDDAASESNETFEVTLDSPVNASLGANTAITYTIIDNDGPPTVQFGAASSGGSEATSPANLTITLSRTASQNVTVNYRVTAGTALGGSDYFISGAPNYVVALKRDSGLTTGGSLASQFTALDSDDVVVSTIKDARMYASGDARYMNYGTTTQVPSSSSGGYLVAAFDLEAYGVITVNKAQLRLRSTMGNTGMSWAGIKSHDWAEGNKNGAYPGTGTAAEGVCWAHPAGLYTTASGTAGWGAGSNAMLDAAGNGADLYAWTTFTSAPGGLAWCVADITSLAQEWSAGLKPNYGLLVSVGNHSPYLCEAGTADQPVLFLDYTVQSGQITFTPGQMSQPVVLTIVNDTVIEPNETIVVTLSDPSGVDLGATTVHTYTINDND